MYYVVKGSLSGWEVWEIENPKPFRRTREKLIDCFATLDTACERARLYTWQIFGKSRGEHWSYATSGHFSDQSETSTPKDYTERLKA